MCYIHVVRFKECLSSIVLVERSGPVSVLEVEQLDDDEYKYRSIGIVAIC